MSDLYRKQGRRYVKVGRDFEGWPADGIWYVHDGASSLMIKLSDVPKDPWPKIDVACYKDIIANALASCISKNYTVGEAADTIINAITEQYNANR